MHRFPQIMHSHTPAHLITRYETFAAKSIATGLLELNHPELQCCACGRTAPTLFYSNIQLGTGLSSQVPHQPSQVQHQFSQFRTSLWTGVVSGE
jgi:hypothetical protein